jgi:Alpha/beta hydrolase domain
VYLIAGTQHTSGLGPVNPRVNPRDYCALPHNMVNASPALRGLLAGLERWIEGGAPPPPSRYPRLGDGTLVPGDQAGFPRVPGVEWPREAKARRLVDYGADFDKGFLSHVMPELLAQSYPSLVPKVDADGNETTGIRLPDIAVPTATVTGWALRAKDMPAAGELCMLDGSTIPFAKTKAERESARDSRPSLEERYSTPADYANKVRQSATSLMREGYLLPEDVERYEAEAKLPAW